MSVALSHGHFFYLRYMKYLTLLLVGMTILLSCEQKTKNRKSNQSNLKSDSTVLAKKYPGQQKMEEINELVSELEEVHSLRWERTNAGQSSFVEVIAFINDDGVPQKIIEEYSKGNFQNQGERHFYLENNKIVAFEDKRDVWLDSNTFVYEEVQTFYNEHEPVLTRKRSSATIADIEEQDWKNIRPESHTLTKVNKILSGEEEFETHFISIIQAQQGLFLLLGEDKETDRYVTTVRVDQKTPFIKDLLNNLEEYKYRPIDIKFKIEGGGGQPQFQVLTDAKWKDEE